MSEADRKLIEETRRIIEATDTAARVVSARDVVAAKPAPAPGLYTGEELGHLFDVVIDIEAPYVRMKHETLMKIITTAMTQR